MWKIILEYCGDSSPLDLAVGMLLLSTHYRHCPRPTPQHTCPVAPENSADVSMLEEATQLVKHATASYGWLMLCGAVANAIEDRSIKLPPVTHTHTHTYIHTRIRS